MGSFTTRTSPSGPFVDLSRGTFSYQGPVLTFLTTLSPLPYDTTDISDSNLTLQPSGAVKVLAAGLYQVFAVARLVNDTPTRISASLQVTLNGAPAGELGVAYLRDGGTVGQGTPEAFPVFEVAADELVAVDLALHEGTGTFSLFAGATLSIIQLA